MDISKLTAEQREALKAQLVAEEQAEKERKENERETYKAMVDQVTTDVFEKLQAVSVLLTDAKLQVFDAYKTLLEMKQELYGYKATQQSHTFTTADGGISITIGHRVVDDYDDTVDVGIAKVTEFVGSLAKDEQSRALVDTVMRLVQKDSKGRLNIGRVVQLELLGERLGNADFKEAISIIKASYRPKKTRSFIEAYFKGEDGEQVSLPLAISSVGV